MSVLHKVIVPCLIVFAFIGIIVILLLELSSAYDREEKIIIVTRFIVSVIALVLAIIIFYVSF